MKIRANGHWLFKDGDLNIPLAICDTNGDVVLGCCRYCGAGEVELETPCYGTCAVCDGGPGNHNSCICEGGPVRERKPAPIGVTDEMIAAWINYAPNIQEPMPTGDKITQAAFMAGWDAGRMPQAVPPKGDDKFSHSLGFDNYEQRAERFVTDWNHMVYEVSTFATKYNLPKPDMIFHPKWLQAMNAHAQARLGSTIINMDVRIRFGSWENVDAFRIVQ